MHDHPDLTQFHTPLETAASSIAAAAYMMRRAEARGNAVEVARLKVAIEKLEDAIKSYMDTYEEGR